MNSDVLVSLITLCGSALGTFAGIAINTKLTNYRIGQLEKKQDKHNKVIERVYHLEQHGAGAILKKWTAKSERWYNNKKRRERHGKHQVYRGIQAKHSKLV